MVDRRAPSLDVLLAYREARLQALREHPPQWCDTLPEATAWLDVHEALVAQLMVSEVRRAA